MPKKHMPLLKQIKKKSTRSMLAIIGISGILLSLLPGFINIPENATGYYSSKALAQLCYNSEVEAGEENKCTDTGKSLSKTKCYEWNNGDRQGNGRGYKEISCPVPTSYEPNRDPVCTSLPEGKKVDCPDGTRKGRCYYIAVNGSKNERTCTTADIKGYDPFNTENEQRRNQQRSEPPRCYDDSNKKIDCPDSIKNNDNNRGKCFKKLRSDNSPPDQTPCQTIDNAIKDADDANTQSEQPESCTERMGLSAGWIVCSVLELVSDGITSLFDIADSLLNVDGQNLYENEELRAIWSYFRVVATFALVIIGLVMVISQALGGGL